MLHFQKNLSTFDMSVCRKPFQLPRGRLGLIISNILPTDIRNVCVDIPPLTK